MRLIIAGGRDYQFTEEDFAWLDTIQGVTEVVSGAARGADAGGEEWANSRGIPVKRFPADWDAYGRSAGPRRNLQMASYAHALAIFPGGKGSAHMESTAISIGLPIFKRSQG